MAWSKVHLGGCRGRLGHDVNAVTKWCVGTLKRTAATATDVAEPTGGGCDGI